MTKIKIASPGYDRTSSGPLKMGRPVIKIVFVFLKLFYKFVFSAQACVEIIISFPLNVGEYRRLCFGT